ncbi:unnamed protein product, partial [Symbiodinium necroappetens]
HMLLDDGLSTVCALQTLQAEWEVAQAKTCEDDEVAFVFDTRLVKVFTEGVFLEFVRYDTEQIEVRVAFQTGAHDVDNNKYQATSLYDMVRVVRLMKAKVNNNDYAQV